MDPITLALLSSAAPIVGGVLGQEASAGARKGAENNAKAALDAITSVQLPDIEKMRLALEQYQATGQMTPEMENAINLGDTALRNVQLDPKYNEYQMSALKRMADVSEKGLTEMDRAQLQQMLNSNAQQNQAQQKQILENRAARGMGGSGNELAAQLAGSQAQSNRGSNEALQLAALAAQRKLDATSGLGNMVQQAQNADYQRQAALQGQRDTIGQFNAQQQQNVQQRNIAARNQAQQANLQNQQNIANANVNTRNQQQQFNRGLEQQQFNNQMTRSGALANAYGNMANVNQQQANAQANMYSQIGSGVGGGLLGAFAKKPG